MRWARAGLPWRSTLGGVLVAKDDATVLLEGAAAGVWDCLERPCSPEELAAACEEAYGLAPSAALAALEALAAGGLCETSP